MVLAGAREEAGATRKSSSSTVANSRKWRSSHHAEILIASFAVLVTEIAYTRVISFKLYYYYVYLVIGLALLGIGAGAVAVAVSRRIARASIDAVLLVSFAAGSVVTVAVYVLVAVDRIDTLDVWRYGTAASVESFGLLIALCLGVFASFLFPGVIVAVLLSRSAAAAGGLYAADLAGAGIACCVVVLVVSSLGAPATVMVAAASLAVGALWVASMRALPEGGADRSSRSGSLPTTRWGWVGMAAVLVVGSVVLVADPGLLPAQRVDASKIFIKAPDPDVYSSWGSIFRVDAAPAPGHPDIVNLYHDGILGSAIYRWDGTQAFLSRYEFPYDARSIPFAVLGRPPAREAVIGAAGGHEVLASLYFGARHVDAVEINPVTTRLVRTVEAGFDGHLAADRRVDYRTGDGRSFLARTGQRFQLIWYPAPDSYAATNSAMAAAYVLSESYLYTTDALVQAMRHLAPGGIFVAQFGEDDNVHDLRTTRFVATARQALADLGIGDPSAHILVAETQTHFLGTIPYLTTVVSPRALGADQIASFRAAVARVPETNILAAPGMRGLKGPVHQVTDLPSSALPAFYRSFPYSVTPTSDNQPYFWHFARYGTVLSHFGRSINGADREDSVGERVLVLLVAVSAVVAAAFLLLPFVTVRRAWRRLPSKALSALFFAGVGFGFIFVEITLMQFFNLFLGYPTYAITVTLAALLVSTGVGAMLARRLTRPAGTLPRVLALLVPIFAFYLWGLGPLTDAALGLPFPLRVILTVVLLFPAGTCFGLFLPAGLREIAALGGESGGSAYAAWGWAVNGFASVLGSALATVLAMAYGFRTVLGLGLGCYLVAVVGWVLVTRSSRAALPTG